MSTDGIDELARAHGADAIARLAEEMDNAFESRDRLRAAEALLDRGYGKPSQAIIAVPASRRQAALLASLSDDSLVAIIEQKKLPSLAQPSPFPNPSRIASPAPVARAKVASSSHGPTDAYDTPSASPAIDPLLL